MDRKLTPQMLMEERKRFGVSQHLLSKKTGVSRYKITMFECEYGGLCKSDADRIISYFLNLADIKKGGVS